MFQLPRNCRTYVALNPAAQWGWSEILSNKMNYLLEVIIWQNATPHKKAQIAAHNQKKPKPYVPDFMKPEKPISGANKDSEAMTVDDVKSWLSVDRGV